ncbi:MAG: hypothetical protein GVY29_03810 [Spirochaetes bacterium]|jgi:hypothetical protein|nr:hypothetical protein [Spirochaetota bacterium]
MIDIYCGEKRIRDILAPRHEEIDLEHIEFALRGIRRFSFHKKALSVHDHRALVWQLAFDDMAPAEVVEWAWYHDDHEGVIGDIVAPIERALSSPTIDWIKTRLDVAIADARGIARPTEAVHERLAIYDKQAATIEWTQIMGYPRDPRWNVDVSEVSEATIRAGLLLGQNTR